MTLWFLLELVIKKKIEKLWFCVLIMIIGLGTGFFLLYNVRCLKGRNTEYDFNTKQLLSLLKANTEFDNNHGYFKQYTFNICN